MSYQPVILLVSKRDSLAAAKSRNMTSNFPVALFHFNRLLLLLKTATPRGWDGALFAPLLLLWMIECREYRLPASYVRQMDSGLHVRMVARRQHNSMRCDLRFQRPDEPRNVVPVRCD